MKITRVLGLMAPALGIFIPQTEGAIKRIYLKNLTGNQVRINATTNGQTTSSLINHKQTKLLEFEKLDSLQITPEGNLLLRTTVGMAPLEYLDQIKTDLEKQGNLIVSINPPESTGWFGVATSYFKPYILKNEMSLSATQELLRSNLQEQFPEALEILTTNPQASFSAAELLGLDPQSSLDKILEENDDRFLRWKYATLQAQTLEEKYFAIRVTRILRSLENLARRTLTSPVPENWSPAKHKSKAQLVANNQSLIAQDREDLRFYLMATEDEVRQKIGSLEINAPRTEKILAINETLARILLGLGLAEPAGVYK